MPLTRYQIRNEYSLADPELYRAADKDDPEALLEGVAMAGLVGVLRQLGDLAEFAAEIFHDLHEEVMATAARGHGLMVRVQQLEAEFPSIEKAFLSQTNHSLFFTNPGVDWHPNLHSEHNLITRGDLPRCVLDSYEECRGPPRLFLLDKFDVAGAGACLKRYTDPSFFKAESALPEIAQVEVRREKKARKVKKKGSRWRNGETPDIAPTSHAKLHQLFMEERIENAYNDPTRLIKLKRRQLNESPLDSKTGKSYMEKFLDGPSPEHKAVYETSGTPPAVKLAVDNSIESGPEILEISTMSPVKGSSQAKENSSSSPNAQDTVLKPSLEELNKEVIDREIVKLPEPIADFSDQMPPSLHNITIEKDIIVDGESKKKCSTDGDRSDDVTSEVDNYMDALATMESEMDTDNEYRPKSDTGFINIGKYQTDSDTNEERFEVQAQSLDSQSVGISSVSDDGNSSFKKGSSFSYSDTVDGLAEDVQSDGEVAAKESHSDKNSVAEIVEAPSIHLPVCAEVQCSVTDNFSLKDASFGECRVPNPGETSYSSSLEDLNPTHVLLDPRASLVAASLMELHLDDVPYDSAKTCSDLSDRDGGNCFVDSSGKQEVSVITFGPESNPMDELDSRDAHVNSDALPHLSSPVQLVPEKGSSNDPLDEILETDLAGETSAGNSVNQTIDSPKILPAESQLPCSPLVEVERNSGITLPAESLNVMKPANSAPEGTLEACVNSECTTPTVDASQTCAFNEQKFSDIIHNDLQLEANSIEVGASHSEDKQNVDDVLDAAEGEETGEISSRLNVAEGDALSCDLPSDSADNLDLKNHVGLDDLATETVQADSIAVSIAACGSTDFDDVDNVTSQSSNLICSTNVMNIHEPFAGAGDRSQEVPESYENISQECIMESGAQEETNQAQGTSTDMDSMSCKSVSYDNFNLEYDNYYMSLAEPTKTSSKFPELAIVSASSEFSDQESKLKHSSHLMERREDVEFSPTHYLSKKETSLEQPLDLHTDQHDVRSLPMVEDSSNSLNIFSNQIQHLDHIDQERCIQTSSEHSTEDSLSQPSLEFSQESGMQDKPEKNLSGPIQPAFCLLDEHSKVSMEEMPPLPPLPPMQWRIGRVQHASPALQRELVGHGWGSLPMIAQHRTEQESQFGVSAFMQGTEKPRNPFLPLDGEDRSGNVSEELANDFMQASSFSMHLPSFGNNDNSQFNGICLDKTESNPFLATPLMSSDRLEYISIAVEHDRVESSYSLLPMPDAECTTHTHIPAPLHEKTIHSPIQFVPNTGLEGGAFQHSKQNCEDERGNPPDISLPSPTERDEQSSTEVAEEIATKVEEQPLHGFATSQDETAQTSDAVGQQGLTTPEDKNAQTSNVISQQGLSTREGENAQTSNAVALHGLAAPEGENKTSNTTMQYDLSASVVEAAWPSDTLAQLPIVEDANANGNQTVKPPRPRNPLIDAVASHDKSKLRKVTERSRPPVIPKVDERDSLLEQIRTKSFNLKPAVVTRPSIQGPKTNLRVAAILEKANAIRQSLAGSDEDDEDGWSDS